MGEHPLLHGGVGWHKNWDPGGEHSRRFRWAASSDRLTIRVDRRAFSELRGTDYGPAEENEDSETIEVTDAVGLGVNAYREEKMILTLNPLTGDGLGRNTYTFVRRELRAADDRVGGWTSLHDRYE